MHHSTEQRIPIVGAGGGTGQLLVERLLARGNGVKALVRTADRLREDVRRNSRLSVFQADLLSLYATELRQLTDGCDGIASCLGHNMTWKGIFAPPYRLVTDATHRLASALKARERESRHGSC